MLGIMPGDYVWLEEELSRPFRGRKEEEEDAADDGYFTRLPIMQNHQWPENSHKEKQKY